MPPDRPFRQSRGRCVGGGGEAGRVDQRRRESGVGGDLQVIAGRAGYRLPGQGWTGVARRIGRHRHEHRRRDRRGGEPPDRTGGAATVVVKGDNPPSIRRRERQPAWLEGRRRLRMAPAHRWIETSHLRRVGVEVDVPGQRIAIWITPLPAQREAQSTGDGRLIHRPIGGARTARSRGGLVGERQGDRDILAPVVRSHVNRRRVRARREACPVDRDVDRHRGGRAPRTRLSGQPGMIRSRRPLQGSARGIAIRDREGLMDSGTGEREGCGAHLQSRSKRAEQERSDVKVARAGVLLPNCQEGVVLWAGPNVRPDAARGTGRHVHDPLHRQGADGELDPPGLDLRRRTAKLPDDDKIVQVLVVHSPRIVLDR